MSRLPEVDIRLEVSDLNVDLNDGRVDAALRYGVGTYPGAATERILEETMSPVCSPDYRSRIGGLIDPADLIRCTLLHERRVLHGDKIGRAHVRTPVPNAQLVIRLMLEKKK